MLGKDRRNFGSSFKKLPPFVAKKTSATTDRFFFGRFVIKDLPFFQDHRTVVPFHDPDYEFTLARRRMEQNLKDRLNRFASFFGHRLSLAGVILVRLWERLDPQSPNANHSSF